MNLNNRNTTLRCLLIKSGILVSAGLGCVACGMFDSTANVRYYASEDQCRQDAIAQKNNLSPEQCQAQFQYAKQEYERVTPVYRSSLECQEDTAGICSESVDSLGSSGWRPNFGGFYLQEDIEDDSSLGSTYIGTNHYPVYPVQPVYQSTTGIVTPARVQIAVPQPGVPLESKYFSRSNTINDRPKGYAAQGTIKGKGSFGNSVRSTAPRGSGGK